MDKKTSFVVLTKPQKMKCNIWKKLRCFRFYQKHKNWIEV